MITYVVLVLVTPLTVVQTEDVASSFQDNDMVTVHLKMADDNPQGGPHQQTTITLHVREAAMRMFGVTKEEVECGEIVVDKDNKATAVRVKDHVFPIPEPEFTHNAMMFHAVENEEPYLLDLRVVGNLTVDSFQDDPTLIPEPPVPPDWEIPEVNHIKTLEVIVSSHSATVIANNKTLIHQEAEVVKPDNFWLDDAGLLVAVINPLTSNLTLHQVLPTSDFGAHRDLKWTLESVLPGRIVVLASVYDGSLQLGSTKSYLDSLGSLWADHYLFRDSWAWVFVKGGAILADALVPNVRSLNHFASPLTLRIELPWNFQNEEVEEKEDINERELENKNDKDTEKDWYDCHEWDQSPEWRKRAIFCSAKDGFGSLCDCENPFVIPQDSPRDKLIHWREDIPILIITSKRTRYLYRLLESLGHQSGIRRDLILIAVDGANREISHLADVLGLDVVIHRPEGQEAARISRNLRFGLFQAIQKFPTADKFIILEDDLILSPDFYSFMQQTSWVLDNDPSVYCVSAFNHLSYAHTAHDNARLYRSHTYPAYGWMTTRDFLEEVLPKWLPSHVTHDWDHFLSSDIIRRGRECILPDVNRSYHGGASGIHLDVSYATEKDYLNRTYNREPDVNLMDTKKLLKEEYELEMEGLLRKAEALDLDEFHEGRVMTKPGGIYVIYTFRNDRDDSLAFRAVGDILGIWNRDARDAHHHTWRLSYKNATLLVVGVPASKYSSFRDPETEVYAVDDSFLEDLDIQDALIQANVPIITHSRSTRTTPLEMQLTSILSLNDTVEIV